MKIITCFISTIPAALLIFSLTAFADSPTISTIANSAPATYRGNFNNQMPEHAGAPTSLTVNSASDFVYRYRSFEWAFNGQIGNAGGNPNGPRAMNWDLPDGNHLRFEWIDLYTIRADFWLKGTKAGQKKHRPPGTSAILTFTPAASTASTPASAVGLPTGYFRLTSMFRENNNECLESNSAGNGPIHMDSCQNVSGQLWKATPAGNGYFRLTSMFREEHGECLESNALGNARSHMDRCQNVTGQMWKMMPEDNGYFRLTSKFRESHNECLESNQPNNGGSHMDTCQNVSGQFWKVIGSNTGTTLPTNVSSKTIELQLENTGMARLTVNFAHDSANLTQEARRLIAKLATAMSADSLRNARYEVQGHTDATGDASYNQSLSEMRVVSVAKELEGIHGISLSRLNPVGYGETRLLDPSLPNSGVNRRVEIHLIRN